MTLDEEIEALLGRLCQVVNERVAARVEKGEEPDAAMTEVSAAAVTAAGYVVERSALYLRDEAAMPETVVEALFGAARERASQDWDDAQDDARDVFGRLALEGRAPTSAELFAELTKRTDKAIAKWRAMRDATGGEPVH